MEEGEAGGRTSIHARADGNLREFKGNQRERERKQGNK
jgi:hypothetical protein